jgi:hypothetical protein
MTSSDSPTQSKRSYQSNRWFLSPITTRFNPSEGLSAINSPTSPTGTYLTSQASPVTPSDTSESTSTSTQTRIRSVKRNQWQKADEILGLIQNDFGSLGDFLTAVFHDRPRGSKDPRTPRHRGIVSSLLKGESKVRAVDIIMQIYSHRDSQPNLSSKYVQERELAFSPAVPPTDILHARPSMSAWATQLVGMVVHREVGRLTKNDPNDPNDCTQLRASSNGRGKAVRVATWDDLASITDLAAKYKTRAPLAWYLTEEMAAPRKGRVIKIRVRRPHPTVCSINFIFQSNGNGSCRYRLAL